MPAGRPTVYSKDMIKEARNYIQCHLDFGDPVPTVAGLACVLGIVRDTCYAWGDDPEKPEFSDILEELAQKQERVLIGKGLLGYFNAPITKMMLTKHGYSDRIEQDHTSKDGTMTPKPAIDITQLSPQARAEILKAADARSSDD